MSTQRSRRASTASSPSQSPPAGLGKRSPARRARILYHWYSVAQPAPSGRSTRALRAGRAAQARDSARAWERNSERSDRAAPTRSTGRSLAVAWSSPHAEGRYRCRFARALDTTRSRPLPVGVWPVAGASEWTYRRHAELLAGVPNPPELAPRILLEVRCRGAFWPARSAGTPSRPSVDIHASLKPEPEGTLRFKFMISTAAAPFLGSLASH